ncbi:MAG: chaperone NapD [Ideonella sp.]|jgi:periplasmic nitrate reductase NapD|nr:chaperone NapD [Ideonella sp.]MBL0151848.1 chaperone NapD [Ideonella sp.]
MSILGIVVRARAADLPAVEAALRQLPGLEIAERQTGAGSPEDGRLVVVVEDTPERAAAATMAEIAMWPEVLNTSLVYEYSGPDAPSTSTPVEAYTDWRSSLSDMARRSGLDPTRSES